MLGRYTYSMYCSHAHSVFFKKLSLQSNKKVNKGRVEETNYHTFTSRPPCWYHRRGDSAGVADKKFLFVPFQNGILIVEQIKLFAAHERIPLKYSTKNSLLSFQLKLRTQNGFWSAILMSCMLKISCFRNYFNFKFKSILLYEKSYFIFKTINIAVYIGL